MRQIVYASMSKIGFSRRKLESILEQSRRYNQANGITGLLWTDGARFAQILEGLQGALEILMGRIMVDPRHYDLVMLTDQPIDRREFGDWSMALRDESGANVAFDARVRAGLARADPSLRPDLTGEFG